MKKFILYYQPTQSLHPYPRKDDQPVTDLDSDYLILEQINTPPPEYDPQTQRLNSVYEIDLEALEYRRVWAVLDLPPVPNYDGFNSYFLGSLEIATYREIVNSIDPDLTPALFDTYSQVASGQLTGFSSLWDSWVAASGITTEDRESLATVAESFNLPAEFVAIIRGENA